jgi:hypothetical protein
MGTRRRQTGGPIREPYSIEILGPPLDGGGTAEEGE